MYSSHNGHNILHYVYSSSIYGEDIILEQGGDSYSMNLTAAPCSFFKIIGYNPTIFK